MAKRVQHIRHATGSADAFTGLQGEFTMDTTKKELRVHDGLTAGGIPHARADLDNVLAATAAIAGKMTAAQVVELTAATAQIAVNVADIAAETAARIAADATHTSDIATNLAAIQAIEALIPTVAGVAEASKLLYLGATKNVDTIDIALNGLLIAGVAITKTAAQINDLMEIAGVQTITGAKTFNSGKLIAIDPVFNTSVSGTAFLDEDDMASNSAVKFASQQSIKAYADHGVPGQAVNVVLVRAGQQTVTTSALTTLTGYNTTYTPKYTNSTIVFTLLSRLRVHNTTSGATNDINVPVSVYNDTTLIQQIAELNYMNVDNSVTGPNYLKEGSLVGGITYNNTTGAAITVRLKTSCSDTASGDNFQATFQQDGIGMLRIEEIVPAH